MKTHIQQDYQDSATPKITHTDERVSVGSDVADSIEEKEIAYAEKNPEYTNITDDITSRFLFYPFSTLSIKPFDISCLKKVYRSMRLENTKGIIEAVSSCIDPDKSAYDLTEPDFWSLMIWLRINSYRKSEFVLNHHCTNEEHIEKVRLTEHLEDEDENKIPYETLYSSNSIRAFNQLNVDFIDPEKAQEIINKVQSVLDTYGIYLAPPTMGDVVQVEDMEAEIKSKLNDVNEKISAVKNSKVKDANVLAESLKQLESMKSQYIEELADLEFSSKYASHISRKHGFPLAERIAFLESQSTDLIQEIEEFRKLLTYGVGEKVKVRCNYCGHGEEVELAFDILTFFPGNQ